jgi:uncharacterized protein (UPF0305 family)
MKIKHNKKRNTAFLFEVLISEMTKASFQGNCEKRQNILSILKEHFKSSSLLGKELKIYRNLLETCCGNYNVATRFLNEMKREYDLVVTNKDIYGEQSRVLNKINKLSNEDIFKNFIPNYKNLATLYQIFDKRTPIKKRIVLEESFINFLCKEQKGENDLTPADNLTYKFFIEKFNTEYGKKLNEEQKKTLTYYIMSFSDNGMTLKSYLNEEVGRLKKQILESKEIENDSEMKEKTNKIVEYLNSFKDKKVIDEHMVQKVLEIQDLTEELQQEGSK